MRRFIGEYQRDTKVQSKVNNPHNSFIVLLIVLPQGQWYLGLLLVYITLTTLLTVIPKTMQMTATGSETRTRTRTRSETRIIRPVWPNDQVVECSFTNWVGSGFESSCSHWNVRYRPCFEQGVPWHLGNYRVWIHSETLTWHDKSIQYADDIVLYFIGVNMATIRTK